MKRRTLKKNVNTLYNDLVCDTLIILSETNPGEEKREKLLAILKDALQARADFVCRLSHIEPGSEKLFFKKLKEEIYSKTLSFYEGIRALA